MKNQSKSLERNSEIVAFFYLVFGNRVHKGMNPDEARKAAYDAVTLRYGIGKGRLLNIISKRKSSQKVNENALRQNAIALIEELRNANDGHDRAKSKNEQLISLLKECIEDDR